MCLEESVHGGDVGGSGGEAREGVERERERERSLLTVK
jgi:hypothetical protein